MRPIPLCISHSITNTNSLVTLWPALKTIDNAEPNTLCYNVIVPPVTKYLSWNSTRATIGTLRKHLTSSTTTVRLLNNAASTAVPSRRQIENVSYSVKKPVFLKPGQIATTAWACARRLLRHLGCQPSSCLTDQLDIARAYIGQPIDHAGSPLYSHPSFDDEGELSKEDGTTKSEGSVRPSLRCHGLRCKALAVERQHTVTCSGGGKRRRRMLREQRL